MQLIFKGHLLSKFSVLAEFIEHLPTASDQGVRIIRPSHYEGGVYFFAFRVLDRLVFAIAEFWCDIGLLVLGGKKMSFVWHWQ